MHQRNAARDKRDKLANHSTKRKLGVMGHSEVPRYSFWNLIRPQSSSESLRVAHTNAHDLSIFVARICILLMYQLTYALLIVVPFSVFEAFREFAKGEAWIGGLVVLALMFMFACFPTLRTSFPCYWFSMWLMNTADFFTLALTIGILRSPVALITLTMVWLVAVCFLCTMLAYTRKFHAHLCARSVAVQVDELNADQEEFDNRVLAPSASSLPMLANNATPNTQKTVTTDAAKPTKKPARKKHKKKRAKAQIVDPPPFGRNLHPAHKTPSHPIKSSPTTAFSHSVAPGDQHVVSVRVTNHRTIEKAMQVYSTYGAAASEVETVMQQQHVHPVINPRNGWSTAVMLGIGWLTLAVALSIWFIVLFAVGTDDPVLGQVISINTNHTSFLPLDASKPVSLHVSSDDIWLALAFALVFMHYIVATIYWSSLDFAFDEFVVGSFSLFASLFSLLELGVWLILTFGLTLDVRKRLAQRDTESLPGTTHN